MNSLEGASAILAILTSGGELTQARFRLQPATRQGALVRQRFRLVLPLSFYALLVHGSAVHAFDRDGSNLQALARARALENQGAYDQAAKYYQAFLREFPSSYEARLGLGRDLARIGRCEEAASALKPLPRSREHQGEGEALIGICYFRSRRFAQAIAYLDNAAKLAPNDKEPRIFLSRAYASVGRRRKAIDTLKAGLVRNPGDLDLLYWIGWHYNELAEQTHENMVRRSPSHYLVHELEGDQFRLKQEYDKALEAYGKALNAAPDAPGIHFKLGEVYRRLLKFDEARRELESELRINPFHAQANFELGDIDVKQGSFKEGMPYLQRALEIDPKLVEAHRSLGKAFLAEKHYDNALYEFSLVARADPGDHTIHALLATAYRQMGRTKEAEEETRTYERLVGEQGAELLRLKAEEQETDAPSVPPPKN